MKLGTRFALLVISARMEGITIDQVFNHQISRAFNRQLRQRYRGSQQLSGIGHRERGQIIDTKLASQFRVRRMPLPPLQFGLSHKPRPQAENFWARNSSQPISLLASRLAHSTKTLWHLPQANRSSVASAGSFESA